MIISVWNKFITAVARWAQTWNCSIAEKVVFSMLAVSTKRSHEPASVPWLAVCKWRRSVTSSADWRAKADFKRTMANLNDSHYNAIKSNSRFKLQLEKEKLYSRQALRYWYAGYDGYMSTCGYLATMFLCCPINLSAKKPRIRFSTMTINVVCPRQ